MPLREHAFSEPVPIRLYVDTDIWINLLVSTQPHHARCRAFIERLASEGLTVLYLSSLLWLELAHVCSRDAFRRGLSSEVRHQFRLQDWQRADVRRAFLGDVLGRLDDALGLFQVVEVPVTPGVRRLAVFYMATYGMGSQDAIHVAGAAQDGVSDFASLDEVYRRVDDLDLWNDLIHGTRAARS